MIWVLSERQSVQLVKPLKYASVSAAVLLIPASNLEVTDEGGGFVGIPAIPDAVAGPGERRLVDGSGRQADVGGLAVGFVESLHRVAEDPVELGRVRGFGEADARELHADRGGDRRLMGAAFGCERHARGRTDNHEARVLIAGIVQRIEAAVHKRIIDRSDGQQTLSEQGV